MMRLPLASARHPRPAGSLLLPGALAILGLTLSACSGGDDTPDSGIHPDAGPADSGVAPDAGEVDAGPAGPCNPVDGTGCEMANLYCVYQTMTDKGSCREIINQVGHEQPCSQDLQNCAPGMACLLLEGEARATCRKVCKIQGGEGCEDLQGSAASYECSLRLQGFRQYAFCAPAADACDPLNNTCGAQENCDIVKEDGTTGCVPAGPQPLGANCSMDRCRRGGVCVTLTNVSMTPTCYEPCALPNGMCTTANYTCQNVGLDFGLCAPM